MLTFLSLLLSLFFASCSSKQLLSYYTRKNAEESGVDFKTIQYYTARKIILRREISSSNTIVKSGKVKLKQGKYINIIKIKKGTPGICVNTQKQRLNISFDRKSDSYIPFQIKSDTIFSTNKDTLKLSITTEFFYNLPTGSFINYDDETYRVDSGSRIKVKKNTFKSKKVKKKKLRGRKL